MQGIQAGHGTVSTFPNDLTDPPGSASSNGDLGAEIALLAVQNGQAERVTSNEARDAQEESMESHDAAEVQAMRDEASSMRTEGWFDAGAAVGGAVLKATCGDVSEKVADGATKFGDSLYKASQHTDEATAAAQKAAADQAESAAQDDAAAAGDANDYVKAALDFYRQYDATAAQTQNAALHRV